jgi:hypothetical protein
MDVVNETKEKVREVTSRDGKNKGSLAKRMFVPLAASAVSGATAYAARKAPGFFQEKVLPKLKEAAGSGGKLDKAKEAVEGAVSGVTDRASSGGSSPPQQTRSRPKLSQAQRERQQRERAARRRERKQALTK